MKNLNLKILFYALCFSMVFNKTQAQTQGQLLFNGKDFTGWKRVGDSAPFSIADSAIVLHQKANTKEHSFLRTEKKYKNFILEVTCKRDPQFYYGILFRAIDAPDTAHARLYGYQVKVDHDKKRRWTGAIFDDFGTTWRWLSNSEGNIAAQNALKNAGEWDTFRIEVLNDVIKVWLNGVPVSHIKNGKYTEGYIALKIHFLGNKPENEQFAAYIKNIRIQTKNVKKYAQKMDLPEQKVD
jgi:hypothetical protein